MPQFFLGVDGGQSSTKAILGDADGRVIGRGSSGPCNHVHGSERETRLIRVLSECVAEACQNAGITGPLNEFQSACFGFSGGAADKRALVERTFHCDQLLVTDDATVALAGATHGAPGVLVLAGTGSIAFGRNAAGQTARAGGWGYVYGDQGSAFDLVRQALRAALRMEEGWGSATALREKLLHACGADDANDLLHRFYTPEWPRDKVAGLAPLVETSAAEGDSIATELLQAAAQQLALLAMAVRRQIFTADEPARVAYAGGVFESPAILERFRTLVELEEGNKCVPPLLGPAEGALLEGVPACWAFSTGNVKIRVLEGIMAKLSIRDLDLQGKRVFLRVDFNVPLANGGQEITSDKRIRASLPTIQYALEKGAGVVLASHLGRPKGKPNAEMSLKPVAAKLAELLGKPVAMAPDCIGEAVEAMKPAPGGVLLLENLRFHPGEEKNDPEFAKSLAKLADVYVNDAFGSAHRAHASTVGIIQFLPVAAAGLLMEKELEYLTLVTQNPPRPCVAILGGAKVSDKIEVIQNLLKVVDKLLIGGAMAYTFLRARNEPTGKSLVEPDKVELAKELLALPGAKLMLPVDHVVAAELKEGAENQVVETIPDGVLALDIGPKTIAAYEAVIRSAKCIVWNGPMGVFEKAPFDKGTVALAKAVAESGAVSVVGGGDSEKAIKAAGVTSKISHVSTGGGASLEFLAGITLPGVAALTDK